jgi:hypothetical protein
MTQDEIIEMARQAGCPLADMKPMYFTDKQLLLMLEAFAKLVAQHEHQRFYDAAMKAAEKAVDIAIALEREACAKLIETSDLGGLSSDPKLQNFIAALLFGYAQTIRARGQA